jgi:tetratricopeptide (TPR) repeat protein
MAPKPGKKPQSAGGQQKQGGTSKWKWPSIGVFVLVAVAAVVFIIYYVRTPEETLVVIPAPLPADLSGGVTKEELGEYLLASIQDIRLGAKSESVQGTNAGPQVASPTAPYVPWAIAVPSFDLEVHKITLNMLRQWALSAKAKHFLNLSGIKSGQTGLRLIATIQDRPDYAIQRSWRVPAAPDPCQRPDTCTAELAEDMLSWREPHTLIVYHRNHGCSADYKKIADLYQSGSVSASDSTDYFAWGDALQHLKEYDDAIVKYHDALEKNHSLCAAYDGVGTTNIRKYAQSMRPEYLEAAAGAYRDALACSPDDAIAHCDLGNVFIKKWKAGKLRDDNLRKEAVRENEKALKINPKLAEAAVNVGYVQYMHGERSQALTYFRSQSQKFPRSPAVFVNLGFLLFSEYVHGKTDALQEALDATRRAWDLDPCHESPVTADNLAVLYYETDSLPDAVKLWETAHELDPTSSDILAGYALGLFKSGKPDVAIRLYQEAVRRDNQMRNADVLHTKYLWTEKAVRDVAALDQAAFPPS